MTGSLRTAGGSVLARCARACWAVWAVVTIELLVALTLAARELTSVWEVQFGLLWLTPTALTLSAAAALLGAFVAWLVEQSETRAVRALLGAFGFAAGAVLGFGVGGGRHLATLGQRGGFAMIVGALVGALVWAVTPTLARLERERPLWCVGLVAIFVLVAELANRLILVRLYPAFHLGLSVSVLLATPFAAEALLRAQRVGAEAGGRAATTAAAMTVGACALSALLVVPSAQRLARFDNFRFVVSEHAPLAGRAVELSTLVAPVVAEDTVACDALGPSERAANAACQAASPEQTGRTLDLRQRDFLLISVDALRADHVGSYGYVRPTTPHIDALAKDAVVFEHAYAATPHTSYSVTSLMTGKYMRPLLLQGVAQDSDTWAGLLRTYGYRTAAFYPPAVFFIDPDRFQSFRDTFLGFEYRWVEFAEGPRRVQQLSAYLETAPDDKRLFTLGAFVRAARALRKPSGICLRGARFGSL